MSVAEWAVVNPPDFAVTWGVSFIGRDGSLISGPTVGPIDQVLRLTIPDPIVIQQSFAPAAIIDPGDPGGGGPGPNPGPGPGAENIGYFDMGFFNADASQQVFRRLPAVGFVEVLGDTSNTFDFGGGGNGGSGIGGLGLLVVGGAALFALSRNR